MARKESLDPSAWFGIGDKELKRARLLLGADDLEGAGFNLQQAVEKYLKGYLLSRGWKLNGFMTWMFWFAMPSNTILPSPDLSRPAKRLPSITSKTAIQK